MNMTPVEALALMDAAKMCQVPGLPAKGSKVRLVMSCHPGWNGLTGTVVRQYVGTKMVDNGILRDVDRDAVLVRVEGEVPPDWPYGREFCPLAREVMVVGS